MASTSSTYNHKRPSRRRARPLKATGLEDQAFRTGAAAVTEAGALVTSSNICSMATTPRVRDMAAAPTTKSIRSFRKSSSLLARRGQD